MLSNSLLPSCHHAHSAQPLTKIAISVPCDGIRRLGHTLEPTCGTKRLSRSFSGAVMAALAWLLTLAVPVSAQFSWTATSADSGSTATTRSWSKVAISGDGMKILAADMGTGFENGGKLYVSTDSGLNWAERESVRDWRSVAISRDGGTLVAADYFGTGTGGKIYTSTGTGASWTPLASDSNWVALASSSNGQKLVAGIDFGRIYTSGNSGTSWTEQTSTLDKYWGSLASSDDGVYLVAATGTFGTPDKLYLSDDSGGTWTEVTAAGTKLWFSVACSGDGQNLIAAEYNGRLWTSTNRGANWTSRSTDPGNPATTRKWLAVASSQDGSRLAAVVKDGKIYTSINGGVDWTEGESNRNWTSIASSSDGKKLVATVGGGQIYVGTFQNAPTNISLTSTSVAENAAANMVVGTLSATDEDVGQSHTFELVSGTGSADNASFNISGTSLRLTASADFEAKSSYAIRLRATDNGSIPQSFEKEFTITITNVNETPSFTKGANQTIANTNTAQTVNGWATAINDGDSTVDQGLSFTITGNNNLGLFTTLPSISSTGTLTYTPSGTAGTATISVTLTDDANINSNPAQTSAAQTFTITVLPPGPSITSVTTPPGSYNAGKQLNFTLGFSVPVTVTGTPRLALTIGSTPKFADYISGSGTNTLLFRYTVVAGENDPDGITLTSPLQLNGGTLKDSLGTNSALIFTAPDTSGVLVDTTPPTVSSVAFSSTLPLGQNPLLATDVLLLKVTMSEPVIPSGTPTNQPKLDLTIGTAKVQASFFGNDSDWISFLYPITAGQNDANGISIPANGLKLNGSTITDLAGNAMVSANHPAVADNPNFKVDTNPPTLVKPADVTILEDAGQQSVILNVTDGGSNIQPLTITATSNNTALIPNPTITPPTAGQTTATLTYQPVADAFGTADIIVTVAENITPGGQSVSQTFKITVTPVNDLPRMTMPVPASVTVQEDADWQSFEVTGINAGAANETEELTFKASHNSPKATPVAAFSILINGKSYFKTEYPFNGDKTKAKVSFKPFQDSPVTEAVTATITVTVLEKNAPQNKTAGTYNISFIPVNDAPTLDRESFAITVFEDAAETEVEFNVSPGGSETHQTLMPTIVSSSNTDLLPFNATTFALVPGSTTAKLKFTPVANQSGTATLRLRVEDSGSGTAPNVNFVEKDFTVTVTPVDDAPSFVLSKNTLKVAPASGDKTEVNFVTGFNANDEGQSLLYYEVKAVNKNLFATNGQPVILNNGTLTFTPGTTAGTTNVTVTAYDNGSPANPGKNSSTQTFTIEIGGNSPPSFELAKGWTKCFLSSNKIGDCKVASSSDGGKLVAMAGTGEVFTTTNSGTTWTNQSNAPNKRWKRVASSGNGNKLLATDHTSVYISNDSGTNWIPQAKLPNIFWQSVASSDDGKKLVIASVANIYTSEDEGLSWKPGDLEAFWTSVASSADGSKLVALATAQGLWPLKVPSTKVYVSKDSGKSWKIGVTTFGQINSVASSADGRKLVAVGDLGILISNNSGAEWKTLFANIPGAVMDAGPVTGLSAASFKGLSVASSADGTKLVVGGKGHIYTSEDSGRSWNDKDFGNDEYFDSVASSSDGSKLVAGGGYGVYTLDQSINLTVADTAGPQIQPNFVKNIKDPDAGQTLSFTVTNTNPTSTLFTQQPTISTVGTLTYTPASGQSGSDTFSVTLSDGVATTAVQTFTITVTNALETSSYFNSPTTPIPLNNQTLQNDSVAAQTLTNPVNLSGNSAIGGDNSLTLTNVTLTDDATLKVGPGGLGLGAGFTSNPAGKTLVKTGPGPLYLNASNFNGNIEVVEGEVILLGSMPNAKVTFGAGTTVKGVGSLFFLALKPGSTITPGASPGLITAVTGTWEGGFTYDWEINRADGTAGSDPGWDYLNHTGTLTISATAENPIRVNLQTLTAANAAGNMVNFNPQSAYAWKIASAAGGITGFDAAAFTLDSSGFTNATPGGKFGIALQNAGRDLVVTYTPKLVQGRYAWTNDASSGISTANGTLWARRFGVDRPCQIGGVNLIPTGYVVSSPEFDLAGSDQNYNIDDTNNLTSLTGQGSAELASRFSYNGNPMVLTFKQLVPGRTYVVTLLSVGFDSSSGVRWQTFSSGADTWRVDASGYGNDVGSRFEYHFTADAPTRVLTITPDNAGYTFALYGLALRPGPNTPPTFALREQPNLNVILGSGAQAVAGFASGMTAGAETYDEGQTVSFEVTTDRPDLFSDQPDINDDGDLTYTPMPGKTGVAKVTVVAVDSGYSQNRSAPVTFTLTIGLPPAPNWSWEGGPNTPKQKGTYPATAGGTGSPGSRLSAATWSDGAGKLYLYGGYGYGDTVTPKPGFLADLWSCDLSTTPPVWTWLGGSKTLSTAPNHGTKGVAAGTNTPGSRSDASTWRDASGNLWLFGGKSESGANLGEQMNDLWKFDGTNWTWVSGSNQSYASGVYGTRGLPTATNMPGARDGAAAWVDASGNLYLFGGYGRSDAIPKLSKLGNLNDLWRFEPATGQWTWLHGSTKSNAVAVYGVKGVPSLTAVPSARKFALATVGNDGLLYLFGGLTTSYNNELWSYNPGTNTWCWLSGSSKPGAKGVIGTRGLPDSLSEPAARYDAAAWTAPDGQIVIFSGASALLDDVWSFRPETRQWTWLKGSTTTALKPVYGTQGRAAASITPGVRVGPSVVTDGYGDVWCFGGGNSDLYADLFKLTPVAAPSAETLPAEDVTYFSATLQGTVSPNGTPMTSSIRYGKQPDLSDAVSTPEEDAGSDNGRVGVYEEIVTLEPGTRYFFQVVGHTEQGTVRGPLRSFVTTGTPGTEITVQFASQPNSVSERAGVLNVLMTLSRPAPAPMTIPFNILGTADLSGDYDIPSALPRFAAGQMQAYISIPIVNDKVEEATETMIFGLGTTLPSGITPGVPDSYTITIEDDDQDIGISKQPEDQFIALRDSLNLSVVATGAGPLTYQWKLNNTAIKGATLSTYTVHNATSAVAGLYKCDVTNPLGTVTSTEVKVFILDPTALNVTVVPGKANTFTVNAFGPKGTVFDYQWIKDNGVTVASTKDFKLTAAKVADTGSYTCLVTAPVAVDSLGREGGLNRLTVASGPAVVFPTATYLALGARDPNVGENLGARVDLTTTGPGTFSARLTTNGVNATAVTGRLTAALNGSTLTAATGSAYFVRVGLSTLRLDFRLNIAANTLTGTLTDVNTLANEPINGFRNVWSKTAPQATSYAGAYNFALEIPQLLFGNSAVPQGDGYGSFTVTADGLLTCAGDTADGLGYTSAGFVGPGGQVLIYAVCKAPGGTLLGTGQIGVAANLQNNTLTGTLSWNRAAEPAASKGVTYRAGLAPLDLTLIGGKYKPASPGGVVRGLVNADNKAALNFYAAGLTDFDLDGTDANLLADTFVFSIRNTGTALAQTIKLPDPKDKLKNYNQVSFTLPASPNGLFTGSFLIPNVTPTLVRKANYKGIIVWDGSNYLAPGYFLLPQTPQPGETTPPILSGQVLLGPNP